MTKAKPVEVRLWSKVDRSGGSDACWPWLGNRLPRGYGRLGIGSVSDGSNHSALAHRLAWELTNGPLPPGMIVCHRCDNPPCCNPAHLFLGTQTDNMSDAASKGRLHGSEVVGAAHYLRQRSTCKHGHPFDEANTLWLPDGTRQCRTCNREGGRRWRAIHLDYQTPKTHCPHGHPYDEANTRLDKTGARVCKTCKREQAAKQRAKRASLRPCG